MLLLLQNLELNVAPMSDLVHSICQIGRRLYLHSGNLDDVFLVIRLSVTWCYC